MAEIPGKLKLGKGTGFVKSRLRYLPQTDEVWEVDFQPTPEIGDNLWTGMVIEKTDGFLYAHETLEGAPTVNDLAGLLAHAMSRPLVEGAYQRPRLVELRDNPEWKYLFPHLRELGIEVAVTECLPQWDDVVADFVRHMTTHQSERERKPGNKQPDIERAFPALAKWVREHGWIEVGMQEYQGFAAKALDEGGLVYETYDCETLDSALDALDKGIQVRLRDS
jgi:hypothetical protein